MQIEEKDRVFIRELDAALVEAVRKGGSWVVCRPGCYDCCLGPFDITQADARRLRAGVAELERRDPARAERIRRRPAPCSDDDPCPALDPVAGTCDLYEARPVICRTFGPAVRCGDDSIATCEKCFQGATDEEIAACAGEIGSENSESGLTTVAESLTDSA